MEEHEREEAEGLGLVGHEDGEELAEADGLVEELVARRRPVPLVEDEVDDRVNGLEPVGQEVVGRHTDRDTGLPDLLLRADEALRHRRLGDEERTRDLVRRQAAEHAQREGDLGLDRERRVAAGEDQGEALVGDGRLVHVTSARRRPRGGREARASARTSGRGGSARSPGCGRS